MTSRKNTTKVKMPVSSRRVITLTEPIARAIAQDAANRQMRKRCAQRPRQPHIWNVDDYNLAAETLDRIWVQPLISDFERRLAAGLVE